MERRFDQKKSEKYELKTVIDGQAMDAVLERCIWLWRKKCPFEVRKFEADILKYKEARDNQQTTHDDIWLIGRIPSTLEFQIHHHFPDFWRDPKNLMRFFRIFTKAYFGKPRRHAFAVS